MLNYSLLTYKERVECFLENQEVDLEQAATYLLNSPDLEKPKKLEHKIFTDRDLFLRSINECDSGLEVMKNETNWKKQKKQTLNAEDLEKPIIKDYQDFINHCNTVEGNKFTLDREKGESRAIQKMVKDRHVIYFKHIGDESTDNDLDWIDLDNKTHVKALLKFTSSKLDGWLGCVNFVLNDLMIGLTKTQKEVLELWRSDNTQEEIGDDLGITQQAVCEHLDSIYDSVVKEYNRSFDEYIKINYIRGKYKKCSKCGETKLVGEFYKKTDNKDGLHKYCKQCFKS